MCKFWVHPLARSRAIHRPSCLNHGLSRIYRITRIVRRVGITALGLSDVAFFVRIAEGTEKHREHGKRGFLITSPHFVGDTENTENNCLVP